MTRAMRPTPLSHPSRRSVLAGAGALTAIGPGLRAAFAADGQPARDILVVMFMRGGQDGLQVLAPAGDARYAASRPRIRVQASGANAGLGTGSLDGVDFYFHPNLGGLKTLYDAGQLVAVQAVGIPTRDRSHFTCQDLMERGLADSEVPAGATGWLARHLASLGGARPALGTIAVGVTPPTSLAGDAFAMAVANPAAFNIVGDRPTAELVRAANAGADPYQVAIRGLVANVAVVQDSLATAGGRASAPPTPDYTPTEFGDALRSLAQLIKLDVGLDTATVDMASWDHHAGLANAFNLIATELSQSLSAFWQDLAAYRSRLTVVVMTEFGRRFAENSNAGLDHGAGSTMLVFGGNVAGGRILGRWPGLADSALDNGSLRVTTDYRQVLAEVLVKRHGETNLARVFPSLSYAPLGLFK
jgi:uncharacterized protein (DUF1501 family)